MPMPSYRLITLTPEAQGFADLRDESERAGYRMLSRFEEAWSSGAGRFDRPGEIILGAYEKTRLIGIGGRSIDPYEGDPIMGRVRHLYVAEDKRSLGIGRLLIAHVLAGAARHFTQINVRAPPDAFGFYEHLGFLRVADTETVTHRLLL